MTLSAIADADLEMRLRGEGEYFRTGPFTVHMRTNVSELIEGIALLYADYPLADGNDFADFHVSVVPPANLRRWVRPQLLFLFDGWTPFKPMPRGQAIPFFEWGLNWAVANHAHQYLILHAAAIEKNGHAVIMPAPPGSGKSTLCAGLVSRGWRLLSDELVLLSLDGSFITPLARPISLKDRSIEVIRDFVPAAVLSKPAADTAKGTVALMKAPADSIRRVGETARPAWIIFPKYQEGADSRLEPRSKAETCLQIGENAFNYSIHGVQGFEALANVVDSSACYDFTYSSLDDAVRIFSTLEPPSGSTHNLVGH
ncbi:MAG: HprK-related kinase A [Rhodospirillales bacterium]|nr:HprK-related kinase A [Rhodospirillales bacterium]